MEVIIKSDAHAAARLAARKIAALVRREPSAVLGLATGRTPIETYERLVEYHRNEGLDFSRVTTFNLDEYVGLDPKHTASYHAYMEGVLFSKVNIDRGRTHLPDGLATDIPKTCREYEDRIRAAGGIDIQILGIGSDGHLGFNEPTSSLSSRTRIKTLTDRTRKDNAAYFGGEESVPRHVITMGLGTIMDAKVCLLLAYGRKKAAAIAHAVEGPVTAMVPASILQMHPAAVVIIDDEAAAELKRADYYRWVYDHKPAWQQD
jgi:glucosamine-6-phosphate deaminase